MFQSNQISHFGRLDYKSVNRKEVEFWEWTNPLNCWYFWEWFRLFLLIIKLIQNQKDEVTRHHVISTLEPGRCQYDGYRSICFINQRSFHDCGNATFSWEIIVEELLRSSACITIIRWPIYTFIHWIYISDLCSWNETRL